MLGFARSPPVLVPLLTRLAQARRSGATTVALTNFPRSPIVDVADHVLTRAVRETTFRSGAMASRLAQLTLVDFMFVGVAQQTTAETRAALEATLAAVSGHRVKPASSTKRRR